jgi:hypothetical protein
LNGPAAFFKKGISAGVSLFFGASALPRLDCAPTVANFWIAETSYANPCLKIPKTNCYINSVPGPVRAFGVGRL